MLGAGYRYTRLKRKSKYNRRPVTMKIHLKVVTCSVVLTMHMFLLRFYMYIHIHSYFTRLTLRSSKSVFVRLFYGEKVEEEG